MTPACVCCVLQAHADVPLHLRLLAHRRSVRCSTSRAPAKTMLTSSACASHPAIGMLQPRSARVHCRCMSAKRGGTRYMAALEWLLRRRLSYLTNWRARKYTRSFQRRMFCFLSIASGALQSTPHAVQFLAQPSVIIASGTNTSSRGRWYGRHGNLCPA